MQRDHRFRADACAEPDGLRPGGLRNGSAADFQVEGLGRRGGPRDSGANRSRDFVQGNFIAEFHREVAGLASTHFSAYTSRSTGLISPSAPTGTPQHRLHRQGSCDGALGKNYLKLQRPRIEHRTAVLPNPQNKAHTKAIKGTKERRGSRKRNTNGTFVFSCLSWCCSTLTFFLRLTSLREPLLSSIFPPNNSKPNLSVDTRPWALQVLSGRCPC